MEELKNKNALIKLFIYVGIFIFTIILLRMMNFNNIKSNKTIEKENHKIIENIKKINTDYYEMKIHLILDDDAITLNYEKNKDIITGNKKYHGENITYIKKENEYYSFNNGEFQKMQTFEEFNYDKNFITLENIQKILKQKTKKTVSSDKTIILTYNLSEILKIFNYNIEEKTLEDKTLTLQINYEEDELDYILINITNLYNIINDKELNNVVYNIKIKETEEEDLTWLKEKIN